jgi:hypothetical protein
LPTSFQTACGPYSISFLNLDDSKAAQTLDAEQVSGDFREPTLLDGKPGLAGCAPVRQDRIPPFGGCIRISRWRWPMSRGQLFHLLRLGHVELCWSSSAHASLEHKENKTQEETLICARASVAVECNWVRGDV